MKEKNIIIFLNGERGEFVLSRLLENNYHVGATVIPLSSESDVMAEKIFRMGLQCIQTSQISSPTTIANLKELNPDLFIVAGYRDIFQPLVIDLPNIGTINLHAGRLPEYRGGSPLNWQLINGENEASASIVRLEEGIDTGPVLLEKTFPIGPKDTISDLHKKANELFGELVLETLLNFDEAWRSALPQDEQKAQYWHQRNDLDGYLDFGRMTVHQIDRTIRGLTRPYPGAWAYQNDKVVRLISAEIPETIIRGTPGRVCYLSNKGPYVVCADRSILIKEYEFEEEYSQRLRHGQCLT